MLSGQMIIPTSQAGSHCASNVRAKDSASGRDQVVWCKFVSVMKDGLLGRFCDSLMRWEKTWRVWN